MRYCFNFGLLRHNEKVRNKYKVVFVPRKTFPFLRLGMAPPAAPVGFYVKQEEED